MVGLWRRVTHQNCWGGPATTRFSFFQPIWTRSSWWGICSPSEKSHRFVYLLVCLLSFVSSHIEEKTEQIYCLHGWGIGTCYLTFPSSPVSWRLAGPPSDFLWLWSPCWLLSRQITKVTIWLGMEWGGRRQRKDVEYDIENSGPGDYPPIVGVEMKLVVFLWDLHCRLAHSGRSSTFHH